MTKYLEFFPIKVGVKPQVLIINLTAYEKNVEVNEIF